MDEVMKQQHHTLLALEHHVYPSLSKGSPDLRGKRGQEQRLVVPNLRTSQKAKVDDLGVTAI